MLDRGIGKEILVVAHDTKLLSINFFDKKSTKHDTFFYIWITGCKLLFLEIVLLSDSLQNLRRCHYIYSLQF